MKKFLAIAVSVIFLLGFAVSAFAIHAEIPTGTQAVYAAEGTNLKVGGDMRVRGLWKADHDFDDTTPATDQSFFDQRYRLILIVATDKGIEARMRAEFGDNMVWAFTDEDDPVTMDWAYLHIPFADGTWAADVGRQAANWGNRFLTWDKDRWRIKFSGEAADNVVVGAAYDKLAENSLVAGNTTTNDRDDALAFVVYKGENITAGLLLVYFKFNDISDDNTGFAGSVYANAKLGAFNLSGEFAFKGGDVLEDLQGDTQMGGFLTVGFPMDALTVSGTFAFTRDAYVADNYFGPVQAFGSSPNPGAYAEFGQAGPGLSATTADTLLLALGADYKATDAITVGGNIGYIDWGDSSDAAVEADVDASAVTVDAYVSYKLAKNTTYSLGAMALMPDVASGPDDTAFSLAHKIEMTF